MPSIKAAGKTAAERRSSYAAVEGSTGGSIIMGSRFGSVSAETLSKFYIMLKIEREIHIQGV